MVQETAQLRIERALESKPKMQGKVALKVFGKHNLMNMMGAMKICLSLGVTEVQFYEAIASFKGAARRLEAACAMAVHLARAYAKRFVGAPPRPHSARMPLTARRQRPRKAHVWTAWIQGSPRSTWIRA